MILSIINEKGGVGKTTFAHELSSGFAKRGLKILLVDFDSQGNLTTGLGVKLKEGDKSVFDFIGGPAKTSAGSTDCILHIKDNLDLLPGGVDLARSENVFQNKVGREAVLRQALLKIKDNYDVIIIDTPPNLGFLTINAVVASDEIFIPFKPEIRTVSALFDVIEFVDIVRESILNLKPHILGVGINMYDSRRKSCKAVLDLVKDECEKTGVTLKIFDSYIRNSVVVADSPSSNKSSTEASPNATVSKDFEKLINEVYNIIVAI